MQIPWAAVWRRGSGAEVDAERPVNMLQHVLVPRYPVNHPVAAMRVCGFGPWTMYMVYALVLSFRLMLRCEYKIRCTISSHRSGAAAGRKSRFPEARLRKRREMTDM